MGATGGMKEKNTDKPSAHPGEVEVQWNKYTVYLFMGPGDMVYALFQGPLLSEHFLSTLQCNLTKSNK